MLKLATVKLASNHIIGMTTWGVGAILLNVEAKPKCDEDLAFVIRTIQVGYAKAFKGAWMECD